MFIFLGVLADIFGFTSEGSVVNFKFRSLKENEIGGNILTDIHLNDITRNELPSLNRSDYTVTDHVGFWWREIFELSHEGGSL